jgi:hypothetical protein
MILPSCSAATPISKRSHTYLYKKYLFPVDDLAEDLGRHYGGWYDFARDYT